MSRGRRTRRASSCVPCPAIGLMTTSARMQARLRLAARAGPWASASSEACRDRRAWRRPPRSGTRAPFLNSTHAARAEQPGRQLAEIRLVTDQRQPAMPLRVRLDGFDRRLDDGRLAPALRSRPIAGFGFRPAASRSSRSRARAPAGWSARSRSTTSISTRPGTDFANCFAPAGVSGRRRSSGYFGPRSAAIA